MSENMKMMDSYPGISLSKRKGVIQGELGQQESGQGDSDSVGGAAEISRKGRSVESDNVAGNPNSSRMVDEPSVHPAAPFGEGAGELEGNLEVPGTPILSGGYANIFQGIWRSPSGTLMDVAVKTLKPIRPTSMSCRPNLITLQQRREKRLKREVAVWTRLVHPNIHPLLGFRTQPEPCLVSPWCQNGNLVDYLDKNPNLFGPEKIQLLVQISSGLVFLHSQSPPICHADIKPENILMNDLCEAALSDFGLSRVIQEIDASTGFTTGNGPKGSQRYMAPELFEEENPKSTLETDIYAFGGLMLAVMSGSPPFAQINAPAKVLFRIVNGIHPKPEEHPGLKPDDTLWSIMLRCWAREPQMRPTISGVEVELKSRNEPIQPIATITHSPPSQMIPRKSGTQANVSNTETSFLIHPYQRSPEYLLAMSSNPPEQYRMQLNTIAQAKYATFDVKTWQSPPASNPTWVAAITVTGIAPSLSKSIYVGTVCQGVGPSKSLATDAAAEQMLRVFAASGVVPTMRR